jgi:hypothetical protein
MTAIRWLLAWLAAVLTATVLGSIIQTQFNLARIAELGQPVPFSLRLETTLHDLAGFAPIWAVIAGLGLLIALTVAALVVRRWRLSGPWLFALAGFLAVVTALVVMNAMLPVTPVGAARSVVGIVAMALPGALAGWLHWTMAHGRRKP